MEISKITVFYKNFFKWMIFQPNKMLSNYYKNFPYKFAKKKLLKIDISKYFKTLMFKIENDKELHREFPPNLNIWENLWFDIDEIKHCYFLSWLLDPFATHCQGNLFWFIRLKRTWSREGPGF
jgi:hypothetical protein